MPQSSSYFPSELLLRLRLHFSIARTKNLNYLCYLTLICFQQYYFYTIFNFKLTHISSPLSAFSGPLYRRSLRLMVGWQVHFMPLKSLCSGIYYDLMGGYYQQQVEIIYNHIKFSFIILTEQREVNICKSMLYKCLSKV